MKIARAIRAAAVVAAASAAMAQLPVAWKNWQYSAPIDAGATDAARYVSIVLPVGVMTHAARGLGDLRVIDDHGKEVPYALSARLGGRASDRRPATLLEPSVVAGQYSQAMFDLGKGARVHNVITIEIEGQDELMTWVEVAVSDDHEHWRVVRERAPIYRLAQPSEAHTTIEYPESVSRYLRVRILDGSRAYHLTGASLTHEVVTEAERVPAGVTLAAQPAAGTTSVWTADAPPLPISEARFETDQKAFYRPVSVETSDDGEHWTYAGSGEIYRTVEAGQPRESLSVQFAERVSGHWRVTVHNRNDAPLAGAHRPALDDATARHRPAGAGPDVPAHLRQLPNRGAAVRSGAADRSGIDRVGVGGIAWAGGGQQRLRQPRAVDRATPERDVDRARAGGPSPRRTRDQVAAHSDLESRQVEKSGSRDVCTERGHFV